MNILHHIAIIPDGNRRWAKKRGLPSFLGHREGAKTTEKIFKAAFDLKIPYLTFWGSSVSNITNRSKDEVNFLFKLFETYFRKIAKDKEIRAKGVKVNVLGRWEELFPEKVKAAIRQAIKKTADYDNHQLTLLMAYSGTDEMADAISNIKNQRSKLPVSAEDIKQHLWTRDLPPVDLVIRTGGEPHWSAGFMMWDVAEAQLHFTETLWPAFSEKEFRKIVADYTKTERRFGT